MTNLPFYQVDAFVTGRGALSGNPAAVMPLEEWLPDAVMQDIAGENNLSETAFLVPSARGDADYDLRWFTPTVEVNLCGHATLATAHVVLGDGTVRFATRSGILSVSRNEGLLWLDMPASSLTEVSATGETEALGADVHGVWAVTGGNGGEVVLLDNEETLRALTPDFARVAGISNGFIIATAPGTGTDFASRIFCPSFGIDEDPVTGSAHCALVPFWASRLDKDRLTAVQASKRGGWLECELRGDRVLLGGRCATVIEGRFRL